MLDQVQETLEELDLTLNNLARAAEDGWKGTVAEARNHELTWTC